MIVMKLVSLIALSSVMLSGCALYSGMQNEAEVNKNNQKNGTVIAVPSSQNQAANANAAANRANTTAAKVISPIVH